MGAGNNGGTGNSKRRKSMLPAVALTGISILVAGSVYLKTVGDKVHFNSVYGSGTYKNKNINNISKLFENFKFNKKYFGINFFKNTLEYNSGDRRVVVEHFLGERDIFKGNFIYDLPDIITVHDKDSTYSLEKEVLLSEYEQTQKINNIKANIETEQEKAKYLYYAKEYNMLRVKIWESERRRSLPENKNNKFNNEKLRNWPLPQKKYSPEFVLKKNYNFRKVI